MEELPDTTAPVITLIGDATMTISEGATFSDPGATASDDRDGNLTSVIVVGGDTVDTGTPGAYVVTYNVSDSSGNPAAEVTRTVVVESAASTEYRIRRIMGYDAAGVPIGYFIFEYDTEDRFIRRSLYTAGGVFIEDSTYEYDSDGNMSPIPGSEEGDEYEVYEYDTLGRPVKISDFEIVADVPGGPTSHQLQGYTMYEYGLHGYAEAERYYSPDDVLTGYGTREIDFDSGTFTAMEFTAAGVLESYLVLEHNTNDDLTNVSYFEADGTPEASWVFEYDSDGNVASLWNYDETGELNHYGIIELESGNCSFPNTGYPESLDLFFFTHITES